jgi:NADPH:quinone reductase-like Zn-dependent oxidoreductase
MKAVVYTEYGSPEVLHLKEVAKPVPKDNEVLIKIHAVSVNYGDILARKFRYVSPRNFNMPMVLWFFSRLFFGFRKPKKNILGNEFAGEIEAVGKDVKKFKEGDPVFGYRGQNMGTYAQYLCMPQEGFVATKPANMSYEEAATLPGGALTALNLLRKVNLQSGQKVLVNGASGGIGSAAVQLARSHFGAEVSGVCRTEKVEFVRALGVNHVIDYTIEDFTENGKSYDLILDILNKRSFSDCKNSLVPNGKLLLASFKMKELFQMLMTSITSKLSGRKAGRRVICALAMEKPEDLISVKEFVEAGMLKSIIDRRFPLEEIAEAHRYIEEGSNKGKVVITLEPQIDS